MIKTVLMTAALAGAGLVGWIGGSIWPAPPEWTDAVNRTANDLRAKVRLANINFDGLREMLPADRFAEIKGQIEQLAVATGDMIQVDHDIGSVEDQLDNLALDADTAIPEGMEVVTVPAAPAPAPASAPTGEAPAAPEAGVTPPPAPTEVIVPKALPANPANNFATSLSLCPGMTITNQPASTAGVVRDFHPVVMIREARISTFPTPGACLSSGFGPRNDRLHKGLDYHANIGVPVLAAGDGQIVEIKYREDYGNMILVDHGGGVFTRYAHLASFARGLSQGVTVRAGDGLGLMGNSAGYQIPIHLHYEVLLGDYANPKGSFGLEPVNPLGFPAAQ
ncbi:MAG: M23 family metallopeptidase [Hyphomonadaceae bacterium]